LGVRSGRTAAIVNQENGLVGAGLPVRLLKQPATFAGAKMAERAVREDRLAWTVVLAVTTSRTGEFPARVPVALPVGRRIEREGQLPDRRIRNFAV
jgi:hypothetical protein